MAYDIMIWIIDIILSTNILPSVENRWDSLLRCGERVLGLSLSEAKMSDFCDSMVQNNPETGNFGSLLALTVAVVDEVGKFFVRGCVLVVFVVQFLREEALHILNTSKNMYFENNAVFSSYNIGKEDKQMPRFARRGFCLFILL